MLNLFFVLPSFYNPHFHTNHHTILNKARTVLNSSSFVEEAKEWNISPDEIQTSFDVVNVYQTFAIDKAFAVIIEILNDDIHDLRKRTKLTLTDIHKFIKLCLSTNYFILDNPLENSSPIGVALMVAISEALLQRLEDKAIFCFDSKFSMLLYKIYVHGRLLNLKTVHQSNSFFCILNK